MKFDLKLDPLTGDLAVDQGRTSLITGVDLVRQRVELRLNLHRGSWPLDLNEGIDYRGLVFEVGVTEADVQGLLQSQALLDEDVAIATATVEFDRNRRQASASVQMRTVEGVAFEAEVQVLPIAT